MDIRDAHTSTDAATKCHLLRLFKEAVSVQAPEFSDRQQKVSQLSSSFIESSLQIACALCINSSFCMCVFRMLTSF